MENETEKKEKFGALYHKRYSMFLIYQKKVHVELIPKRNNRKYRKKIK